MNISTKALALTLALASASAASATGGLPPNHPPVPAHLQGQGHTQGQGQGHAHGTMQMHPTLARFSSHSQFRCPYATEWLTKGAHKAAIDLGLTTQEKIDASNADTNTNTNGDTNAHAEGQQRRRHLQEASAQAEVLGSCTFASQWSGPSCLEFRGAGWTEASITERCASEPDSTLSTNGCPQPTELAGFCLKEASASTNSNAFEATSMMISTMSNCDGQQMACETFVGGAFQASAACGGGGGTSDRDSGATSSMSAFGEDSTMGGGGGPPSDYASMGPPSGGAGDTSCMIAPGAIGAAHQSGFSSGYSNTCPGTPAEGSPYMWPMAWAADVDTQSLAFGVDDVVHQTKGRTFYRLDKNSKRSDTLYSKGVRRGIGQGPCENIDEEQSLEGIIACKIDMDVERNGDAMETMIHRRSKMYFITWKNSTMTSTNVTVGETDPSLIDECHYMDLMVIGNIRPDWFLDDRGDDTDVQYLGDQHVYYASNTPRLVKQWRKKDFASQYFTMSVAGNPPSSSSNSNSNSNSTGDDNSIRWPLVLNIPGEGFGDDMLQVYHNHELLTDADDDLFDLVDNLEASGGSCPLLTSGMGPDGEGDGTASFGPPTNDVHVPSNLEVDDRSWFTSVYTFSPVWQPPLLVVNADSASASTVGENSPAVTDAGRVVVESCYDPTENSVRLSVEFKDIAVLPSENGMVVPWMSLGYRSSAVCAMTPPEGGDTNILVVSQDPAEDFPKAYASSMGPATKSFAPTALGSIYGAFVPLEEAAGYSKVALDAPMLESKSANTGLQMGDSPQIGRSTSSSSVTLSFQLQAFDTKPEILHLMYAIGSSATLGFHTSRSCFEVVEFPTCVAAAAGPPSVKASQFDPRPGRGSGAPVSTNTEGGDAESGDDAESSSSSSSSSAAATKLAFTTYFLGVAVAVVGSLYLSF